MPESFARQNSWRDDLWLLTEAELEVTPKGTVVTSINGKKKTVGVDEIDRDTRFGYLAWGLYSTQFKH
jgi:hypothetical protein